MPQGHCGCGAVEPNLEELPPPLFFQFSNRHGPLVLLDRDQNTEECFSTLLSTICKRDNI